jgi:uncharacterized membrane protein YeaQ/YmgE (transglycosylase-associated protein family)
VLIPGIIGPMIGEAILKDAETIENTDGTTSFIPNEKIFIGALVVIVVLAVYLVVMRVVKNAKKRSENEQN